MHHSPPADLFPAQHQTHHTTTVVTTAARTMTPTEIPMMALAERGAEGGAEGRNSDHNQQPLRDREGGQSLLVHYCCSIHSLYVEEVKTSIYMYIKHSAQKFKMNKQT